MKITFANTTLRVLGSQNPQGFVVRIPLIASKKKDPITGVILLGWG